MLVWSICKCTISIIDINNGIRKSIHGFQNVNTSQILTFGGHVKVRILEYPSHYLGSRPLPSILILEQFCLDMAGLTWYINPYGIKYKTRGVHSVVKLNTTCNKKKSTFYIKHHQNGSKFYQFFFHEQIYTVSIT